MNARQARRAQARATKHELKMSNQHKMRFEEIRLEENKDRFYKMMDKILEEERQKAFKSGAEYTLKCAYACLGKAARERFGFGRKRLYDLLKMTDELVGSTYSYDDAVDELWKDSGLYIDFKDPFERIKEAD